MERGRDLGVGLAAAHRERDVVLPGAQCRKARAGALAALTVVPVARHQRDEPAGDCGGQHPVPCADQLDRPDDLRRRGVLEQEARRPGLQCAQDQLVRIERREHQDRGRIGLGGE
jgi:hypothetical protein